jgi:lipooligosaccharide transport system ATP-binding protein
VTHAQPAVQPAVQPAGLAGAAASGGEVLIRAHGLTKRFGDFTAVDGIDVEVYRGEAFGFLGPNGAGKSSTMRMIGCVSPPSAGELRILGLDPRRDGPRIRARLGVVPQRDTLDEELTVHENLVVYARYFGLSRRAAHAKASELIEFAQLTDRAGSRVEPLSGGMKRRLTIARSLVNDPQIMLLDEPTTGLDPQARHVLWDRLFRLKRQGVTLVLTTHYMDEAEQLCDRLVVMDGGRIVAEGTPRSLIDEHSSREVLELRFAVDDHAGSVAEAVLTALGSDAVGSGAERVEVLPDRLLVYTPDGEAAAERVHAAGLRPISVLVRRSTLEDVFLRLTGRTLVD